MPSTDSSPLLDLEEVLFLNSLELYTSMVSALCFVDVASSWSEEFQEDGLGIGVTSEELKDRIDGGISFFRSKSIFDKESSDESDDSNDEDYCCSSVAAALNKQRILPCDATSVTFDNNIQIHKGGIYEQRCYDHDGGEEEDAEALEKPGKLKDNIILIASAGSVCGLVTLIAIFGFLLVRRKK